MRRLLLLLLPALLFAACGDSSPKPSPTAPQLAAEPTATPTFPPPPSATPSHDQFYSVDFISSDVGWAAGAEGIFATKDGGAHWVQQYQPLGEAYEGQVDFLDSNIGFALSRGFIKTRDGGAHWDVVSTTAADAPSHVDFTSPDAGWAIWVSKDTSDLRLWPYSADGDPITESAVGPADSVCFADARFGWYAGGAGVARTVDGGTTWTASLERPLPNWGENHPWKDNVHCAGRAVAWVQFVGGIAAGHQAYAVFRTVDGGAHWSPVMQAPVGPELGTHVGAGSAPGPVAVIDEKNAWVAGVCGPCEAGGTTGVTSIEATHDGGLTWGPPVAIPAAGAFSYDLQFADLQHGWLATTNGIFATADGGRTWLKQR